MYKLVTLNGYTIEVPSDPAVWATPADRFPGYIEMCMPRVDADFRNRLLAAAQELNAHVRCNTLTSEAAQQEWEDMLRPHAADIVASTARHSRREWIHTKVPPLYLEAINVAKLPNRYAYERVMQWWQLTADMGSMSDIKHRQFLGRGLICFGRSGMGKSRSIYARIIRLHIDMGVKFIALPATTLYRDITAKAYANAEACNDYVADLINVPILFIDDLCKIKLTPRFGKELVHIVEQRTAQYYPVLITTQLVGDDLIDRLSGRNTDMFSVAEALVRRMRDFCQPVDFDSSYDAVPLITTPSPS